MAFTGRPKARSQIALRRSIEPNEADQQSWIQPWSPSPVGLATDTKLQVRTSFVLKAREICNIYQW
jgi:hypothetical protein